MAANAFTDIVICRSVIALETTIHLHMPFSAGAETWYCLYSASGRVPLGLEYGRAATVYGRAGASEAAHGAGTTEEEAGGCGGAAGRWCHDGL